MKTIIFAGIFLILLSISVSAQYSLKLDFDNPSNRETEPGWTSVGLDEYNETTGYGWLDDSGINGYSKSNNFDDLMFKDYHSGTSPRTFRVKLPAGYYDVKVNMSTARVKHLGIELIFEGKYNIPSPTIWGNSGDYATEFRIPVEDGYLDIMADQGPHSDGADGWVLSGIEITEINSHPSISSSSSLSHGGTFFISGSNFGVKNPAPPLLYDDFEGGVEGQIIKGNLPKVGHTVWDGYAFGNQDAIYSAENNFPGSLGNFVSKHDLTGCGYDDDGCPLTCPTSCGRSSHLVFAPPENLDKMFMSFWSSYDFGTNAFRHQVKNWRVIHEANWWIVFKCGGWGPSDPTFYCTKQSELNGVNPDESVGYSELWEDKIGENQWYQTKFQARQSSPNTADGSIMVWLSRAGAAGGPIFKYVDLPSTITTETTSKWDYLDIGEWCTNLDHPTDCESVNYFDDFYLDNSWARIEIGDEPVYDGCSKREVQIPQTWSTGAIAFTANQGTFSDGQTVYLFVVDESGTPNPNGYLVSFGEAPPCEDGTRSCNTGEPGICAAGTETCSGGVWGECIRINDPENEICDDVENEDEDCDGLSSCSDTEDCSANPACIIPTCTDGTNYDECSLTQPLFCSGGELINDCTQCDCPNLPDICETDGSCTACVPTTEICNNGTDEDCDTTVDCNDSDCLPEPECQSSSNEILKLDFGTNTSPVEVGWVQVGNSPLPSLAVEGYGWAGPFAQPRERRGDNLTRDFHFHNYYAEPPVFSILLPNGDYNITYWTYDSEYGNDSSLVDITAEGQTVLAGVASNPRSAPARYSFNITVEDGQLDISSSGTLQLNGLIVAEIQSNVQVNASACTVEPGTLISCSPLQYQYDSDIALQNVVTNLQADTPYNILIENTTTVESNTLTQTSDSAGILQFT
ncbi:MAG: hypothetical protein ABID38_03290 [Candidatus Diapherotrites archaeon]